MKKILYLSFFLGLLITMKSQSVGYLGKKLLLKTNVINGKLLGFKNADLEYVLGRRTSLVLSFQHFDYKVRPQGITRKTGTLKPGNNRGTVEEKSTLKDGVTKGNIVSCGVRHYFGAIIPAPYGYYIDASIGFGRANLTNFLVSYELGKVLTNYTIYPKADSPVLNGTCVVLCFELPGVGYQKLFKSGITIDARLSFQAQYCKLPEEFLNAFDKNYYLRTNTVTYARNGLSFGPAVFVKLGFLLF